MASQPRPAWTSRMAAFTAILLLAILTTNDSLRQALPIVATLLLCLSLVARGPRLSRWSAQDTAPLFFTLVIAGLTWAGILRFRPSPPPASGDLTGERRLTPAALGRFVI